MRRSERDEAFTEYVAARRAHLRRTAYLICGDWHAAEDLVQTALTRLYTAWPRVIRRDAVEAYARRIILFTVAKDHLDPSGEHLSMASNVQGGGTHRSQSVGTKLNWKVPGESGLGMVEVGIATPGMTDADRRFEIGCGGSCERHGLGDGTSAWVRRSSDGVIGAAYEQSDGGSVWVLVDPLFGNNSLTPVSSVDVSVDDLLAYVTDARLRWLDSSSDQPEGAHTATDLEGLR